MGICLYATYNIFDQQCCYTNPLLPAYQCWNTRFDNIDTTSKASKLNCAKIKNMQRIKIDGESGTFRHQFKLFIKEFRVVFSDSKLFQQTYNSERTTL